MYAIVETGGKQLKVEKDSIIFVEKLECNPGDKISLDKVVLVGGENLKVGSPYVSGAKVECSVVKNGKAKKIIIFKYKAKKGSTRRKQGLRQPYTQLKVESIVA